MLPPAVSGAALHLGPAQPAAAGADGGAGARRGVDDRLRHRHALLPAVALGLSALLGPSAPQRLIVVLFAALPTASSCYVLATRMGGDGAFVAGLVTLSTLLGMVGIPLWLAAVT